jgi:hypothetical protein
MIVLPPGKSFPHAAYYSTQPFLAWCLNHYVYDKVHYVWACRYLYPYKSLNPKSSNPFQIFQDLYQPTHDRDPYDSFLVRTRIKMRTGVEAVVQSASSGHAYAHRYDDLLHICDHIDETFFWPVIYIVDNEVAAKRGKLAYWGRVGSEEKLIQDLKEDEFALLISDYDRQSYIRDDIEDFVKVPSGFASGDDAIEQLKRRS